MALTGRKLAWIGCWNYDGLNFKTTDVDVRYSGTVSIETAMTYSWIEDTTGFTRVGIEHIRYRDGSREEFFLEPCAIRKNVEAVRFRVEVGHARVRGTITVDFWG